MAGLRIEPSRKTVLLDLFVDGGQDPLLDLDRGLDVVSAVDHDLGLHDRDQTGLLADACISREVLRCNLDGQIRGAVVRQVHLEGRTPLGEARAPLVILLAALKEVI